jgi:uncharacterized protein
MHVTRYTDLAAFAARVEPYLFAHEAEHCLPIGILSTRLTGVHESADSPYLACFEEDDGRVALVAIQTLLHNLVLSLLAEYADPAVTIHALVRDLRAAERALPGAIGPNTLAASFADAWSEASGVHSEVSRRERIFQLQQVRWPQPVAGAMRHIEERDRGLLRNWLRDFIQEALGQDLADVDGEIDSRLRGGARGMYLWEDGQPVSLAGFGNPTPHGIRIGPVYTPPGLRGRGYASALVAHTSQRLLDEGRQFCFLFTDLANPTSNHVYQQIGYQPVSDAVEFAFQAAASAV